MYWTLKGNTITAVKVNSMLQRIITPYSPQLMPAQNLSAVEPQNADLGQEKCPDVRDGYESAAVKANRQQRPHQRRH